MRILKKSRRTPRPGALPGLLCALLLSACAWTFDDDQLDVVVTGTARSIDDVAQHWDFTLKELKVMQDPGGLPWVALDGGDRLRLSSVLHPEQVEFWFPVVTDYSRAPSRSVCMVERSRQGDDNDQAQLRLHYPGERVSPSFVAPFQTAGTVRTLCGERTMVYWLDTNKNAFIELVRRVDGPPYAQHLRIPWPRGANPAWDQGPLTLSRDDGESVLLIVDGDYHMLAVHIDDGQVVDLGVMYWGAALPEALSPQDGPPDELKRLRDSLFFIDLDGFVQRYVISQRKLQPLGFRLSPDGYVIGLDPEHGALLTCDWDGLRSLTIYDPEWERSGRPRVAVQRVLDPQPCSAVLPELTVRRKWLTYFTETELRTVRLDGTDQPVTLTSRDTEVVWSLCRGEHHAAAAFSTDPPDRYGKGVGDGWLGSWRFLERGREVRLSADCERLRWKEHAANLRKLGELRSARLDDAGQPPLRLARNVSFYQEMPDGRLLASIDAAVIGPTNKLVLIDEDRRTAEQLLGGVSAVTGVLPLGPLFKDRLPAAGSGASALDPDSPLGRLARSVLLEYDSAERTGMRRVVLLPLPPRQEAPAPGR